MRLIARILGVILVLFGVLGLVATSVGKSMQMSIPALGELEWTRTLRSGADYAIYGMFVLGGVMLLRLRSPKLQFGILLFLCAGRLGYDLVAADLSTARGETILRGDLIAVGAAVLGLLIGVSLGRRLGECRPPVRDRGLSDDSR